MNMEIDNEEKAVAPNGTTANWGNTQSTEQNKDTKINDIIEQISTDLKDIPNSQSEDERISVTGAELLSTEAKEIPCLIEPILPQTGLACIAGASDTGKSALLRQLCIDVVSKQKTFLGFKINARYHSAIYVSTEDDENAMSFLLHKQNNHYQCATDTFQYLHFIFDTEDLLGKLEKILQKYPVDLICIDAFADLYNGGSLNETDKVRRFLHNYEQLIVKYRCAIIFLHHCGKRTEDLHEPSKHNLLGSQGLEAKMRLVLELRTDQNEKNLKHFCIVKGNYLPAEYKTQSFVLFFGDNMTFSNTGERVEFSLLTKEKSKDAQRQEETRRMVEDYLQNGMTQRAIAQKYNCSLGKVNDRIKEGVQLSFNNEQNEQKNEQTPF